MQSPFENFAWSHLSLCVFLPGHRDQTPGREECSWGPVAPSWSCGVGCRLSVWAHPQRESGYQWCSKKHIIASQHGILTHFQSFYQRWGLSLSVLFSSHLPAPTFFYHFHSLPILHFNTSFISFLLSLVSFHPFLPCLFSSVHVSLYSLILIFPPPIFVVFEFNLTARLQK